VSFGLLAALATLATFAAVALLGSLVAWAAAPRVERERDPAARARRLLALRVLPSALGLSLGAGLVLPAFLRFEPRGGGETPGIVILLLASMGGLSIAAGLRRLIADLRATRALRRLWEREGRPVRLPGSRVPACAIRHPFPVVSVVGVLRPRLFVAEQVLRGLSEPELSAVVAHEAGHLASLDNLKRLALRLVPALPWPELARRLDDAWDEAAEEAADAEAGNALELAAALVKTARLVPPGARLDLPVAALHRGGSVARRVRLLTEAPEPMHAEGARRPWEYALCVAAMLAGSGSAPVLAAVHEALERLVHLL
jgi:hypothetical protein